MNTPVYEHLNRKNTFVHCINHMIYQSPKPERLLLYQPLRGTQFPFVCDFSY